MLSRLIRLFCILAGFLLIIGGPFLLSYLWQVALPMIFTFIISSAAGVLLAVYLLVQGFCD